ncbi:MAG: hypothetical protein JNN18_23340 [Rubrivivax sp.]|nr:hypothetical protein [Rubrivivax sp.]
MLAQALMAAGLAACGAASQAQVWLPTSGTRNWFDAANWSGGAVPATGGNVFISAGGAAVADPGLGTLPLLSNLLVGTDETGRGLGVLSVVPAGPLAASPLNLTANLIVGRARTTALAQGSVFLDTGRAFGLSLGEALSPLDGTVAQGTLSSAGSFILGGGLSTVGAALGGGRDTLAAGRLEIGGDAGSAMLRWVGATESAADGSTTGKRADGEVRIRGDFALDASTGVHIGRTVGTDRVVDPLAVGGFRRDTAIGSLTIEGTAALRGSGPVTVGVTTGGSATGSVALGRVEATAGPVSMAVGVAGPGGEATGSFRATQGDLATAGHVRVGVGRGGNAQGNLTLTNGRLRGDGSSDLVVGEVAGDGSTLPISTGRGSVGVRSLEGFRSLYAGTIQGDTTAFADGTSASGQLTAGSGSTFESIKGLAAGWANLGPRSTGQVSTGGRMVLGGTVTLDDGVPVHVGSLSYGGSGSTANGDLRVTLGDLRDAGLTYVGRVLSAAGQAGKAALGTLFVREALLLGPRGALIVGETRGEDRNGALFDRAQGRATLGSLVVPAGAFSAVAIGVTEQGQADGRVSIGSVDSRAGPLGLLQVGVVRSPSPGGEAHGELSVSGGELAVIGVRIGDAGLGTALGRIALQAMRFTAEDVLAGQGAGGRAELVFSDVLSRMQRLQFDTGSWSLERSLVEVDGHMNLGADTLLHVEVDGLRRGDEYGAIDAARAVLGGALEVDFGDLVFGGDSAVFDLLRSASASGLAGDFLRGVRFVNVPAGYRAWGGQELDSVEVYRVHLERLAVPSPGTLALLLGALLPLARGRRVTSTVRAS